MILKRIALGMLAGAALGATAKAADVDHVLLISIDGMHALDYINCASGVSGVNGGDPYCPHLAALRTTGINYLDASTSKPSDSFPGLMAIVSGGSPRSVGAFYDVAYDRSLDAPATTTGNGVAGSPNACTPGAAPTGTTTEFDEGIDLDQSKLNGGGTGDGGIASIDPHKLPRDPARGCAPVYPWNFVRTKTIFGVIHEAGGYTAWSDKHPSYSSVAGPGNGRNLDDYYSPEINSIPVPLRGVVASSTVSCSPNLPDQTAVSSSNAWTDSFLNIQCYDTLKVNAVLNQIGRKTHDGLHPAPVPTIFGMNFQAVSVGQKLIEKSLTPKVTGGYLDSQGTPSPALLSEIQFVDASIGKMISALRSSGVYDSTLLVITAKHGQSPVDSSRYTGITSNGPVTTSPATILDNAHCLPTSESPSNPTGIGPTEDDVSMIWLNNSCTTAQAVTLLETQSPANANTAGIGQIFSGPALAQLFNAPGLPPHGDPRTPDILVTPNVGVTYSGSSKKQAEHGGFAHDDTNVIMLLSNPKIGSSTVTSPVETMQVAPTILKALGLDPKALQSVAVEGTEVLPGAFKFER
ncbi:MAG: nucleotide pyrophosphatase [Bradyrhizobium sp.]|uniref:alkaline phosphatase family protein n=1 Tax=Bradyrhizobium sp. TaxID=376 RepID=UPI0012146D4F|nr:alkaline phosphatase family protein [Bradyrhizobium sp.]THD57185.1 MAG: nucleotide pyrophosphatase [Bradyrhizobium sp.]